MKATMANKHLQATRDVRSVSCRLPVSRVPEVHRYAKPNGVQ